jgi:hypothetical protein
VGRGERWLGWFEEWACEEGMEWWAGQGSEEWSGV